MYYLPKARKQIIVERLNGRLSDADMACVNMWLDGSNPGGPSQVIGVIARAQITQNHFSCLQPGWWINDEIINATMVILQRKHTQSDPKPSHVFSSFFYSKLRDERGYSYDSVRRWTKKMNVFKDFHKIYIPINMINFHWFMIILDMGNKHIIMVDSVGGSKSDYLATIFRLLQDEGKKLGLSSDHYEGWTQDTSPTDRPLQKNGYDCGIFALTAAEMSMMSLPLLYDQSMMPFLRARIAHEIIVECKNPTILTPKQKVYFPS
jgi:Ulp1 family protease